MTERRHTNWLRCLLLPGLLSASSGWADDDCNKYLPTSTRAPSDLDKNDLYQKRGEQGERCEGIYAPGTSRALDARIELMGAVMGTDKKAPSKSMTLKWSCGQAHVRVVALEKLKYQMDVQAQSPYDWPTDLLKRFTLGPEKLAAVAITQQGNQPLYCPVRIGTTAVASTGELPAAPSPTETVLRFKSAEKLKDIKASLLLKEKPEPLTTSKQGASKQFIVRLPSGLIAAGATAVLRIDALIDDGGAGTQTSADFSLGGDEP